MKKKNEKEKTNVATERKDDDNKFVELYINKIGLRCEAVVVQKKVRFDDKVTHKEMTKVHSILENFWRVSNGEVFNVHTSHWVALQRGMM